MDVDSSESFKDANNQKLKSVKLLRMKKKIKEPKR